MHDPDAAKAPTRGSIGGAPLTEKEILMRIETCQEVLEAKTGSTRMRFAWLSQRGYYPDAPSKPNQDSYSVVPDLMDDKAFFAVYDGHGRDGHDCAYFCRDHLPLILKENLSGEKVFSTEEMLDALRRTHVSIHRQLTNSAIDDSLSGTTAVSVLFDGDTIYVSNVGDSRAILVYTDANGKFAVTPLSKDHTPYRADERERIKKMGARIMSMEQLEGLVPLHENWGEMVLGDEIDEGGDPPRVWSPYGDYPGTAFSRSIGDSIAKDLGVIAEPEILTRKISSRDKFVIIASDGVFEFLTNQNVMDIVTSKPDILSGCKAVVQQAYELWLRFEVRTDDITMIIIEVENEDVCSPMRPQSADVTEELLPTMAAVRPVRRVMSREKRRSVIFTSSAVERTEKDSDEDLEIGDLVFEKSESDKNTIRRCLKGNMMFSHLTSVAENSIIDAMRHRVVARGDVVISQGDEGDSFYVVAKGRFEARVRDLSAPASGDPGEVVMYYEQVDDFYPCFGELSLMYGSPRGATVIALEEGDLWYLDRKMFRKLLYISEDKRMSWINVLHHIPIFSCLHTIQLQSLADVIKEEMIPENQSIVSDRDRLLGEGEWIYIISSGTCDITSTAAGGVTVLYSLQQYDYFSDNLLKSLSAPSVDVVTTSNVGLFALSKSNFERILGPVSHVHYSFLSSGPEQTSSRLSDTQHVVRASAEFGQIESVGTVAVADESNTYLSLGKGAFMEGLEMFTMQTFVFSKLKGTKREHIEILRKIEISTFLASENILNSFLPRYEGLCRYPNAIHFLYRTVTCGDLEQVLREKPEYVSSLKTYKYVLGCAISALQFLHVRGIVYRNIQPEGIHFDGSGRIILIDYFWSKRLQCWDGMVTGKTFTLCGAPEFFAPELLEAGGYNNSVDYWALGVLLCELACAGVNPFAGRGHKDSSQKSDFAIFSKISSFKKENVSKFRFPANVSVMTKELAAALLDPCPQQRIGMQDSGASLRNHGFFESFDWNALPSVESPLLRYATSELSNILADGPNHELKELWELPQSCVPDWIMQL